MHTIKDQRGIAHLLPVLIVGVLLLVGGSFYMFMQKTQDAQLRADRSAGDVTTRDVLPEDLEGLKPLEEVSTIAVKDAEGTTVQQVELEQEDGVLVYKVVRSDQQVLVINAKTGAVISTNKAALKSDHAALPAGFSPGISLLRAREIAVAERPGSKVGKIHLSMEYSALTYSVRFTDKSRVDINAADGTVLRVKDADGKVVKKADSPSTDDSTSPDASDTPDSIDDDQSDSTDAAVQPPATSRGVVNRDQAIAIANERLPEKAIKEVQDELEYGIATFSVRYLDGSRVDVRKSDGAIVRVEAR